MEGAFTSRIASHVERHFRYSQCGQSARVTGLTDHSKLPPSGETGNGKSALRSVVLEIPISPSKGLSSSKIRKIAPANESAHTNKEAMTTRLARANKVKLTKIAQSQKTRMI